MKVYQNGELQETVEVSTPPEQQWDKPPAESHMYLGRPNNADHNHHHGIFAIGEWYYWNNPLSYEEIRNVMKIRNFLWDY